MNKRLIAVSAGGTALACGAALGQVGFRPATEVVAVEPPPNIVPMNAGQVILGLADRYVYRTSNTSTAWGQTALTADFVTVVPLALPPGGVTSYPVSISSDGRRVLGQVSYTPTSVTRAALWQDGGAPLVYSVGNAPNQRPQQADDACDKWVLTTGLSAFDSRTYVAGPDGFVEVEAYEDDIVSTFSRAISPDGTLIAGKFNGVPGPVFVWDQLGGARQVEPLNSHGLLPVCVSNGGGTVVCGAGGSDPGSDFLLSAVYSPSGLRMLTDVWGTYLSRDGAMVLGYTNDVYETPSRAIWWTPTLGSEDLNDALVARGIDLRGWTLKEARFISADGRRLVGRGFPPGSTQKHWWVAEIESLAAADVGKAGGLGGSDGKLDNNDFIVFIHRFFAQDARADVGKAGGARGGDGKFDNNDFCAFIGLFFGGEP